jgi:hypothetical protein
MTFNNEENEIQDIFEVRLIEWCENRSSHEDYGVFESDEVINRSLSERDVNLILICFILFLFIDLFVY